MSKDLTEFLKHSRTSLECLADYDEITVVIGNEACDLDSAVSAVVFGFFLGLRVSNSRLVVPVLNINKEDYALKTEVVYMFDKSGITQDHLIFKDDLNLRELQKSGKLSLVLVDHNVLKAEDEYLAPTITQIIDHHELINTYEKNIDQTIETVGSCCTLIAEKLLQSDFNFATSDATLLLYATIILDTVNLSPASKKATEKDVYILKSLEKYLNVVSQDDLFEEIQKAKSDVSGLTVEQILRKDLKEVLGQCMTIGIASIPISIFELLQKPFIDQTMKCFCDDRKYQVLIIMAISFHPVVERQVAIYSSFDSYRRQVEDVLEDSKVPYFGLEYVNSNVASTTVFKQRNVTASRKALLPLVHKFLVGGDSPLSPMANVHPNQSFSNCNINDNCEFLVNVCHEDEDSSATGTSSGLLSRSSAPFTPHNSYVGSTQDLETILPSFNSREMVDRIENKRSTLIDGSTFMSGNIPFTPKNSFVDSTMEQYLAMGTAVNEITRPDDLIEKVRQKMSSMAHLGDTEDSQSNRKKTWADDQGSDECLSSNFSSDADDKVVDHNDVQRQQIDGTITDKTTDAIQDVIIHNNNTTAKDDDRISRDDEEKQDLSKSLNGGDFELNHSEDAVDPSNYTAQTVDFPDSPHQLKLLQQKSFEVHALKLDEDYDEDELRAALSPMSNQSDHKKAIKRSYTMPVEMPSYLSSDFDDEYFEDDIMGGLSRSYSLSDASSADEAIFDEDPSSDQLEMRALERMAVQKKLSEEGSDDEISDKNNNTSVSLNDSFLFDEKASNDGIDKATLRKVKCCFDGQRIKDLYMLSGRLQDMISQEEIEEILTNVQIYSEFIDDEIIEVLASKHRNGHSKPILKKTIDLAVKDDEKHRDECRIRAVFEQHCRSRSSNDAKNQIADFDDKQTKIRHEVTSSNIRAFFEESLVKSASTLKIIHAKIDDNEDSNIELSVSPKFSDLTESRERPTSLDPLMQPTKRRIQVAPDILRSKEDDQKSISSLSNHSETDMFSPGVDDLMTPDDIDTPDELDESILERFGSIGSDTIPEMSAAEEYDEERSWRTCYIAGIERRIDLKVIEPYKKVLSHGGYYSENRNAIILFSACYLPDRSRRDYDYVMDNLFLYVLTTLDALVAEDYILIYLHGATQRSNMPSFGWLKRCYQMIDRRLRKNLKQLFLVHPSFWVKTIVIMTKPFISTKFSRKLRFISNLQELGEIVPLDDVCIPDKVKQFDEKTKTMEEAN